MAVGRDGVSLSIVCGTYGDDSWVELAQRAVASAEAQTRPPDEIIHVHAGSLHEARNQAIEHATSEWVSVLDADDTLDPGFVEAMARAASGLTGDHLLQPNTIGVYPDGTEDDAPALIPARKSITEGNWLVIGTAIRREQFLRLGGFQDIPVLEDWLLWGSAVLEGAIPIPVPDAIYRIMVRPDGRNSPTRVKEMRYWYQEIRHQLIALDRMHRAGLTK